jgi:hypothetical protein
MEKTDQLFAEDLHHGFALSLVHLCESLRDQRAILLAAVVEHLTKAECGVPEQDLCIPEALVVVRNGEVDFMCQELDTLQHTGGVFHIPR